jgi:hypothetical protein
MDLLPKQAEPKIPSSLNVRKKVAISDLLYSRVCGVNTGAYRTGGRGNKLKINAYILLISTLLKVSVQVFVNIA